MAGLVLSIAVLATSTMSPAFAEPQRCVENQNAWICIGGQPEVGDSNTFHIIGGHGPCIGTVELVSGFDGPEDRLGRIAFSFDSPCGSITGGSVDVKIVGPL